MDNYMGVSDGGARARGRKKLLGEQVCERYKNVTETVDSSIKAESVCVKATGNSAADMAVQRSQPLYFTASGLDSELSILSLLYKASCKGAASTVMTGLTVAGDAKDKDAL